MKARYHQFNPKRRFVSPENADPGKLEDLAERVRYGGNPEHKMNPGDFGLSPPSQPRQGKSLCDAVGIFKHDLALDLLRSGARRGLVSEQFSGGWPKNIWAVTDDGKPLEAQLENPESGRYHGYPMPASDPLATEVLKRWRGGRG